ncbi:unnamed protein product [Acanthoscelides obtectus]|uniref:Uncharacterized protein n=1 Tax=Acanthoscelides obtectus TaxID=200917 RepID=A0A9P0LAG2_ACAOB|nr:unnamed protein product [Acanthoscelides obtectus]CAK1652903.1 hypothetical protein AOBTE_LOCUS17964 [Acanthoscelides obtectus]
MIPIVAFVRSSLSCSRDRCAGMQRSLLHFFRVSSMSYESGTFPENWKFTDPYSYRSTSIALLSVINKMRCINRELLDYLERHGLISDRQYGFRHQELSLRQALVE